MVTSAFCRLTICCVFPFRPKSQFLLFCPFLRDALMSGCFRFVTQSPCRSSRLWGEFFFLFSDSTLPTYLRCVFPSYFQKNGCLRKLSLLRRGAFLLCLYISIGIPGLQDGILYKMANFSLCKERILVIYTISILTCSRSCARINLLGGSLGAALSVSKKPSIYVVIPNQSADWCGNPPDRSKSHWFRI